jgi:hypothetical protein
MWSSRGGTMRSNAWRLDLSRPAGAVAEIVGDDAGAARQEA